MPLARANCGSWWATVVTAGYPRGLMAHDQETFIPERSWQVGALIALLGTLWHGLPRRRRILGGTCVPESPAVRVDRAVARVWYGGKEGQLTPRSWRRMPMADKSSDPLALWQKMMGEMEKGYNAFANQ